MKLIGNFDCGLFAMCRGCLELNLNDELLWLNRSDVLEKSAITEYIDAKLVEKMH